MGPRPCRPTSGDLGLLTIVPLPQHKGPKELGTCQVLREGPGWRWDSRTVTSTWST